MVNYSDLSLSKTPVVCSPWLAHKWAQGSEITFLDLIRNHWAIRLSQKLIMPEGEGECHSWLKPQLTIRLKMKMVRTQMERNLVLRMLCESCLKPALPGNTDILNKPAYPSPWFCCQGSSTCMSITMLRTMCGGRLKTLFLPIQNECILNGSTIFFQTKHYTE